MKKTGLNLKKKLQSKAGETIAETLVTMIILSLAVLMLAGAVVTAARVNKQADNTDTSFRTGTEIATGTTEATVTLSEENATGRAATDGIATGGSSKIEIPVRVYQSRNSSGKSYVYYKVK